MYIAVDVIVGEGRAGSSVQESASTRPHFKTEQGTGHLRMLKTILIFKLTSKPNDSFNSPVPNVINDFFVGIYDSQNSDNI